MINSLSLLQFYTRHQVPLDLIDCAAIAQEPFGPTTLIANPGNGLDEQGVITYARRVRKEGLYIRDQDLDRVFGKEKAIFGADNLEQPSSSVSVSSLDQCSGEVSIGFASVISILAKMDRR
jgi:hypothetical protein